MGLGEREGEGGATRREREGKRASLATYRQRMLKLTSPPAPIPVVEVPEVPIKLFFQSFLSYFQVDSGSTEGAEAMADGMAPEVPITLFFQFCYFNFLFSG